MSLSEVVTKKVITAASSVLGKEENRGGKLGSAGARGVSLGVWTVISVSDGLLGMPRKHSGMRGQEERDHWVKNARHHPVDIEGSDFLKATNVNVGNETWPRAGCFSPFPSPTVQSRSEKALGWGVNQPFFLYPSHRHGHSRGQERNKTYTRTGKGGRSQRGRRPRRGDSPSFLLP